jgi:subtilisin family serine protease
LRNKIDPKLLAFYDTHALEEEVSFLALLKAKGDAVGAVQGSNFKGRGHIVYRELTSVATTTQAPLLKLLRSLGVEHRAYWIVNMVHITANSTIMALVASHESIRELQPNFKFKVELEQPETSDLGASPSAIEWNINWVNAPQVWAQDIQGQGLVVANADTGVQWDHPALILQYRGYGGVGNISHSYNWWDAVHTTGSSCGANTQIPCDDNGHGTHTTGTAVGDDHLTNQIGVAPRAKWIGCRNMNAGFGTPTTYIECMQFFIAPTDLSGNNPNPDLAPHVIGNSWGCPSSEGCSPATLQEAVSNVVAAGIFMSVSAGNAGSSCGSVNDPPAIYADVMSVAASGYQTNTIATYSSRGPVTIDGSNRLKPDITAPGSSVRSSYPSNRYVSLSGTSMASPHITGIIALLWQAHPVLERDIDATTKILYLSATSLSATTCTVASDSQNATVAERAVRGDTRNNVYGYGQLNAAAAVATLL